jgi:hypothetical protein
LLAKSWLTLPPIGSPVNQAEKSADDGGGGVDGLGGLSACLGDGWAGTGAVVDTRGACLVACPPSEVSRLIAARKPSSSSPMFVSSSLLCDGRLEMGVAGVIDASGLGCVAGMAETMLDRPDDGGLVVRVASMGRHRALCWFQARTWQSRLQ